MSLSVPEQEKNILSEEEKQATEKKVVGISNLLGKGLVWRRECVEIVGNVSSELMQDKYILAGIDGVDTLLTNVLGKPITANRHIKQLVFLDHANIPVYWTAPAVNNFGQVVKVLPFSSERAGFYNEKMRFTVTSVADHDAKANSLDPMMLVDHNEFDFNVVAGDVNRQNNPVGPNEARISDEYPVVMSTYRKSKLKQGNKAYAATYWMYGEALKSMVDLRGRILDSQLRAPPPDVLGDDIIIHRNDRMRPYPSFDYPFISDIGTVYGTDLRQASRNAGLGVIKAYTPNSVYKVDIGNERKNPVLQAVLTKLSPTTAIEVLTKLTNFLAKGVGTRLEFVSVVNNVAEQLLLSNFGSAIALCLVPRICMTDESFERAVNLVMEPYFEYKANVYQEVLSGRLTVAMGSKGSAASRGKIINWISKVVAQGRFDAYMLDSDLLPRGLLRTKGKYYRPARMIRGAPIESSSYKGKLAREMADNLDVCGLDLLREYLDIVMPNDEVRKVLLRFFLESNSFKLAMLMMNAQLVRAARDVMTVPPCPGEYVFDEINIGDFVSLLIYGCDPDDDILNMYDSGLIVGEDVGWPMDRLCEETVVEMIFEEFFEGGNQDDLAQYKAEYIALHERVMQKWRKGYVTTPRVSELFMRLKNGSMLRRNNVFKTWLIENGFYSSETNYVPCPLFVAKRKVTYDPRLVKQPRDDGRISVWVGKSRPSVQLNIGYLRDRLTQAECHFSMLTLYRYMAKNLSPTDSVAITALVRSDVKKVTAPSNVLIEEPEVNISTNAYGVDGFDLINIPFVIGNTLGWTEEEKDRVIVPFVTGGWAYVLDLNANHTWIASTPRTIEDDGNTTPDDGTPRYPDFQITLVRAPKSIRVEPFVLGAR